MNRLVDDPGVSVSGTLEERSLEDLEWIVAIHFWVVVHGCKLFLPHLRRAGDTRIGVTCDHPG